MCEHKWEPMGQGGTGRYTPSLDPTNGKDGIFSHLSFSHLIFFQNFPSVKKKKIKNVPVQLFQSNLG